MSMAAISIGSGAGNGASNAPLIELQLIELLETGPPGSKGLCSVSYPGVRGRPA
jgi:hypothetical protein